MPCTKSQTCMHGLPTQTRHAARHYLQAKTTFARGISPSQGQRQVQGATKGPKPKADWCTTYKDCEICKRYQTLRTTAESRMSAAPPSPRAQPPSEQDATNSLPAPATGRPQGLLLDVFAGRSHPVTSAAVELGLDCFEPFDLDRNSAHNILDDTAFEALLKLCWPGAVALIMLAPPCKEYSRLKLRRKIWRQCNFQATRERSARLLDLRGS